MDNSLPDVYWDDYVPAGEPVDGYRPVLNKLAPGPFWHDQFGRFYPDPDVQSVYVNPPRSRYKDPRTGDVFEVVLRWGVRGASGVTARTVLHYVITNTVLEPTTQQVADGFAEELADLWPATGGLHQLRIFTPINYGIIGIDVRNLSKPGEEASSTKRLPVWGAVGNTTPLSVRTAMLVRKSIVAHGKVGSPCLRWPHIDHKQQTAGFIDHANSIRVFNQYINDYRTVNEVVGTVAFTASMYVLQRAASKRAGSVIVSLVTSLAIEPIMSSVRGRLKSIS